jgi:oxalate decarboxylase
MGSIHTFDLDAINPQAACKGGIRTMVNENNFSLLKGMALYLLRLDSGGVREPHWHPNAAELSYCLSGSALMTIFSPGAGHNTFTVNEGEIVYIPKGFLHHIENINHGETKFAIAFNHEMPEDIGISGAFGAYSNEVLGSIFGLESKILDSLPKYQEDLFVVAGG